MQSIQYIKIHPTITEHHNYAQFITVKLELIKIKNYVCHNCKVKYFTPKEKRTNYNTIHFFLFFLLGFLPFLSFCNKPQCQHDKK